MSSDNKEEPPRRLSVRDEGYDPAVGQRVRITFDGEEQSKVIAYDYDAGTVLRYATDAAGKFILSSDGGDAVTEEVSGDVRVEWLS